MRRPLDVPTRRDELLADITSGSAADVCGMTGFGAKG